MVAGTIIPDLQKRAGSVNVIKSRTLRTWGQSESGLAELLEPRIAELNKTDNPTLAFLASGIEGIKVRITAKAQDHATAQRILDEEDARLRAILGELVFGIDQQTMESVVIDQLRERNLTLAVTESITGGLMSARLTAAPYANEVLRGGIMLGSGEPQSYLLGMSALPADPETATRDMALIACRTFQADVGLAVAQATEANEPSARAANKIFLAIAIDGLAQSKLVHLPGRRESVRQFAVINLLNMLRLHLTADGSA
jgi:nicotinamide-nucleotide amidase